MAFLRIYLHRSVLFILSLGFLLGNPLFAKKNIRNKPTAKIESILTEFNDSCIRFHIMAHLQEAIKLASVIQRAKVFTVYRKASNESSFKEIYKLEFPKNLEELSEVLDVEKQSLDAEDANAKQSKQLLNDVLQRKRAMMLLSIFSPKMAPYLGVGYQDCKINKNLSYSYFVRYELNKDNEIKFPKTPIEIKYKPYNIHAPNIQKIEPLEAGAKITFLPLTEKQDLVIIGYNIYRAPKEGAPVKVNDQMLTADTSKAAKSVEFSDSKLSLGKYYQYYITGVTFGGAETKAGEAVQFYARSLQAPKIVQKVKVDIVDVGFKITWTKLFDKNVVGYNVYKTDGTTAKDKFYRVNKALLPPTKTEYIDVTNFLEKRYLYRVTAVNQWGNESAMSSPGFITYVRKVPPAPPESISVLSTDKGNQIRWKHSKDQKLLKGYLIYRTANQKEAAVPLTEMLSSKTLNYLDKDASPGASYWYTVVALSLYGIPSEYPAPILVQTIDARPVRGPNSFEYAIVDDGIMLYWEHSRETNVQGYRIYKEINKKSILLNKELIPRDASRYVDKGQGQIDSAIVYEIEAVNSQGKASENRKSVTIGPKIYKMNPPTDIKGYMTKQGVRFIWNSEPGIDDIEYMLFRRSEKEKEFKKINTIKGSKMGLVDILKDNQKYTYFFKKINIKSKKEMNSRYFTMQRPKK